MYVVPIQNVEFDDAATSAMGEAFDRACASLRRFGALITARELIAKRIIDAAKNGERDPARLHEQALVPFGIDDASMLVVSVGRDAPRPSLCFDRAHSVIIESPALYGPSPSA
jgi:tartrate dehydratase beta subunit/fumarate hydratase class I family protein